MRLPTLERVTTHAEAKGCTLEEALSEVLAAQQRTEFLKQDVRNLWAPDDGGPPGYQR